MRFNKEIKNRAELKKKENNHKMKGFLKTTLAVIVGVFVAGILASFMFFSCVGGLMSSSEPVIPRSGILKMDLSQITLTERSTDQTMAILSGSPASPVSLWTAIQAINKAAADPGVKFLYIKPDGASGSIAQFEELRQAIVNFRKSGKAVVSYVENPTTASYYLASASDKVYMLSNAGASPMIVGVGSQMIFLKDLLDKLGVNVQLIRHGKYKSAGEMYIKNSPSPENLEQNTAMINSIWESLASAIEESRGISKEDFSAMVDNLMLNDGKDMLENKLVDELLTKEEMREKIAGLGMYASFDETVMIPFQDYVAAKVPADIPSGKQQIAIVYADGDIVEGGSADNSNISGDRYATLLAKLRKDKNVKAVVLRVSSPGGSVLASDKIKTEIDLLRAEKPVIASFGAYAASGGYWISASCDKVYTDNTTLTGSIGCFSMIPDLSRTAKDILHIGVTTVGSSRHSGMYSAMAPLTDAEKAYMQKSIESIYSSFVNIVAEGRDLEPEFVDSIAQGRVWTGADALGLGLADERGTLEDAVKFAALSAGNPDVDSWSVNEYPRPASTVEVFMSMLGNNTGKNFDVLSGTPFESVGKAFGNWNFETSEHNFARMEYDIVIR